MNITTENIEEWCFRYLEKDLDEEERLFFEKELKSNTTLQKEHTLWQKTLIQFPSRPPADVNFMHSLFRYKSQLLVALTEFALLSALVLTVLYSIPTEKSPSKKQHTPLPKDTTSVSTSPVRTNFITVENSSFKKHSAKVDTTIQQIDRCNDFPKKGEESKIASHDFVDEADSTSVPQTTIEQKVISSDTSLVQHTVKEKKKNKTSGSKRNGSRLVPINNDL